MPRIVRNTLLNYVPKNFLIEREINSYRIFTLNKQNITKGNSIIYLCEREMRLNDNYAIQYGLQKSKELSLPLKLIIPQQSFAHNKFKEMFISRQINRFLKNLSSAKIAYEVVPSNEIMNIIQRISPAILITDFNPLITEKRFANLPINVVEIDGHNVIPARFISDKQEYSAATLRVKIYHNIFPFLTEYKNYFHLQKSDAERALYDFIDNKLDYYAELKNSPDANVVSGLSKYLNLGFISSQRIALEVIKSDANDYNKEVFLEELIVRKELSENFCFYCDNYKSLQCIPLWAQKTLEEHKADYRQYLYDIAELESAKTHDELWNATQNQLILEGTIHGYLRMYWAKKLLEWSETPKTALETAIYLNDKYAIDAPSPNGYVGILWAIGGLHDRPFQNYNISGKVRKMTEKSIKNKYSVEKYIKKYKSEVNY